MKTRGVHAPEPAGNGCTRPPVRAFMPHQQEAFNWAKDKTAIALFMQMRLGKTMVAIRWAEAKRSRRNLVIAPYSVLIPWERELRLEGIKATILSGPRESRVEQARGSNGWFLINPEGLVFPSEINPITKKKSRHLNAPIADMQWDTVIVDESTIIRKPSARITRCCIEKFENVRYRAILSGYPAPESLLDYYCQMAFLYGGVWFGGKNWWAFRHYTCRNLGYSWTPKPGMVERVKDQVHRGAFVLTRERAGIGSKKIRERRYVKMTPQQKKLHRQIDNDFEVTLSDGSTLETKWLLVKFNWLKRLAGGILPDESVVSDAKYREIKRLLRSELTGQPVVIWFKYNRELFHVRDRLREDDIPCTHLIGATKLHKRKQRLESWEGGRYQVLLVQSKLAQRGMDFSYANTSIYYSNYFDGEVREQSEDRVIHPQKQEPVLLIDLITEGSIDEDALDMLDDKSVRGTGFMQAVLEKRYAELELSLG